MDVERWYFLVSRWHFCFCPQNPFLRFETMSQSDRYTTRHNATYDPLSPSFPMSKHDQSAAKGALRRLWGGGQQRERSMCHLHSSLPSSQPSSWVNASDPFPRARKTRAMPNNCAARSRWNARHASGVQWHTASLWHGQIRARRCWRTGGRRQPMRDDHGWKCVCTPPRTGNRKTVEAYRIKCWKMHPLTPLTPAALVPNNFSFIKVQKSMESYSCQTWTS